MFAEISQHAFDGQLVTGLSSLAALAVAAVTLFRRTPPIDATFATRESLDRHIAESKHQHENIFSKIGGVERGLRTEIDHKVDALRNKVDAIGTDVSSVVKEAEMHTQQLAALDTDIKQLLAR